MKGNDAQILDPTKRFQKLTEIIESRFNVTRFKGYDTQDGSEVTWNELNISSYSEARKNEIISTCKRLQSLHCENLISLKFSWLSENNKIYTFITESTSSHSIKSMIQGNGPQDRFSALQRWFEPVLNGLAYLHSQTPPIVHTKVKPNSIFIKPTSKHVKLFTPLIDIYSILYASNELRLSYSTPPDALFNQISPATDIWGFGLAFLYTITGQEPYSECDTPMKLITKLSNYQPPDSLKLVTNQHAHDLLSLCFQKPDLRPKAVQLLKHPFFTTKFEEQDTLNTPEGIVYFNFSSHQSNSSKNGDTMPSLSEKPQHSSNSLSEKSQHSSNSQFTPVFE